MTQKKEMPTKEQIGIIKRNGLTSACWVVLQDLQRSMIVRHRITGEVRVLDK